MVTESRVGGSDRPCGMCRGSQTYLSSVPSGIIGNHLVLLARRRCAIVETPKNDLGANSFAEGAIVLSLA